MFGEHVPIFGGVKPTLLRCNVYTTNVYMLNKASCNWDLVDHMPSIRDGPSAVSIAEDKIFVLGGVHDKDENYEPIYTQILYGWVSVHDLQ